MALGRSTFASLLSLLPCRPTIPLLPSVVVYARNGGRYCNQRRWQLAGSVSVCYLRSRARGLAVSCTSSPTSDVSPVKKRVVSGVQPTGSIHLGNYLGAIKNWVSLQDTYETLFFIVDLHAITLPHDAEQLSNLTRNAAAIYMACGIDPSKSSVFAQSHVQAHAELTWLLNCVTPIGWLNKMIQFKEKSRKACDFVPVGEDQKQHLELTRELAERVNFLFGGRKWKKLGGHGGKLFKIPEAFIPPAGARIMSLTDGLSKTNAGITTQLLLSFFEVKGIVHYGIAGNADPSLHIGDVTIPRYWAHTGLWNWQRYGDGPDDELPLESNGDYTREIGFLHFADFQNSSEINSTDNLLNNVWFQPEEIFPVNGAPEVRQHAFWVPVDDHYYQISMSLQGLELESCVNATTCLSHAPRVVQVDRGCSANVYMDNAAYRSFIRAKFNVTAVDMESAAVALVSVAQAVPFIAIRALSDLAGGGSAESNEASTFASLAAQNAVTVVFRFVKLLQTESLTLRLHSR